MWEMMRKGCRQAGGLDVSNHPGPSDHPSLAKEGNYIGFQLLNCITNH